jgi:MFS family permease
MQRRILMSNKKQLTVFLNYVSLGILLPVLNLILLNRGADLKTLPLLIASYSAAVLCFELPSGICADLYGRKTVFLISGACQMLSLSLLLFADNWIWLLFCILLNGISRAFSSGSLDALIVDQALQEKGETCLPAVSARLGILEETGLAAGCILGGFLSCIGDSFTGNILARGVFTAVTFGLCLFGIREDKICGRRGERIPLTKHVKRGVKAVLSKQDFPLILAGMLFTGFFLISIETYWQPAYLKISKLTEGTWVLGILSFAGFLMAAMGNSFCQRLLKKFPGCQWQIYSISRFFLGCALLVLALQKNVWLFILGYGSIYLLLGTGSVAENTLINQYTPGYLRASVLSLGSFLLQAGSMSASLFCSLFVDRIAIPGLWLTAGAVLIGYTIFMTVFLLAKRTGSGGKELEKQEFKPYDTESF